MKDDPQNFEAWTKLLAFVEQKDDLNLAGDAYEGFLKLYPFCFGYWRKYAEFEKRHRRYEKALNVSYYSLLLHLALFELLLYRLVYFQVYERGLREISLSVDLWLSYIAYIKDIAQGQRQADAKIRA